MADLAWRPPADASPELRDGIAALEAGRLGEAAALLTQAPESRTEPEVAYRVGVAHAIGGDAGAAIAAWRGTLRLDATFAPALYDLGVAYTQAGEVAQAGLIFARLLAIHSDHAEGRFNYGNLLFRIGRAEEAVAVYAPLLDAPSPSRDSLVNIGRALRRAGRLDEADACYRRSLLDRPDDAIAHWNRAHVLFLQGRWAEGFAAFEHRLAAGMTPPLAPALPEWTGGALPPRLLLLAEQGHGDAIQCLRYVPEVAARGCAPVLAVHESLVGLVRALLPGTETLGFGAAADARAEAHAPLFSLPHRLGLPEPGSVPEPARNPAFDAGIAALRRTHPRRRPRIGLVWAGNPGHDNDRWRSMPKETLLRLVAARPDLDWVNLQFGDPEGPRFSDFAATARAIGDLDLLIAVDTAAAHVAGTLGVPVWLLLAAEPDWRWGITGSTTPWYASARLFRQGRLGDWKPVIGAVEAALPPAESGE
jgi:Tfp pilus assembly protein PilF